MCTRIIDLIVVLHTRYSSSDWQNSLPACELSSLAYVLLAVCLLFSTHNFDASNQQVATNYIYQRQTCTGSNKNNNNNGNALNKLRFFLQLIKSNHFAIFGAWQKTNKKCAKKLADTKRTKSYLPRSKGGGEKGVD